MIKIAKISILTAITLMFSLTCAFSQGNNSETFGNTWDNQGANDTIKPYKTNAYGSGLHSDAAGRPFEWRTREGETSRTGKVKLDAYGPGIGQDSCGRPVKAGNWGE